MTFLFSVTSLPKFNINFTFEIFTDEHILRFFKEMRPLRLQILIQKNFENNENKVLLRERKTYTARRIASTRYAVPLWGTPPPDLGRGYSPADVNRHL